MVDTHKLALSLKHLRAGVLRSRKSRIIAASSVFLTLFAFGAAGVAPIAPDASDLPVRSVQENLALPTLAEQVARLGASEQSFNSEEKIRPGDSLATLLNRLGVNDEAAATYIKTDAKARSMMQLRPGRRVQATVTSGGQLLALSTTMTDGRDNPVRSLVVSRAGEGFRTEEKAAAIEKRVEMRTAEIRSSLFAATDSAQIPDAVALQLVDMFATNIDFASDLRRGDRFSVVYETWWQGGDYVRAGRVLAAEFQNGSATYQSVWFDEPGSRQGGGYYGFDGKSLKKAFLKSPLEFSRVSSGFSMRMHPISGMWKQHKGVDFAAPTGTPIRAAGDGVIDFAGSQGGYGNVVVIKHWSNYTTAYAHMSRFAPSIRRGAKVSQGEVIGYVGSTGWSTGPHLHYEFRIANQPRDPMSVDVPNAQPLAGAELQRFRAMTSEMSHRLALLAPQDKSIKLAAR
ncbi:MAG: family metallopeptidase [Paucimonas sp.]|jgi:murein DD-endopeptidase MepM/ murein hydrolase activator NlpD|nr:family metallopeptidase [Paucimonas sp.]